MDRREITVVWTGASFVPQGRDMRYCQFMFGPGEVLICDPEQQRDMNSHRHYFAQLRKAYDNLPEGLDLEYPTFDIFRKKLLIKAGYFNESRLACDSETQAATVAAFMAPLDPSMTIMVSHNIIFTFVARSQSVAAMGRREFQKSKWAVLDIAASLINVMPKQLERHAAQSEYEE